MKWYVADFETTDETFYEAFGYTKVWLWSICDENAEVVADGDSIETFMEQLRHMPHATIYFHNLKFDGSFIIDYLLSQDIPHTTDIKNKYPAFSTLIDDMGAWYKLVYRWSKSQQVTILDSLKLLPFKVEKIAKDFELPIQKEKIDYSVYEINETTLSYIHNDVRVVAMALAHLREEGLTKLTIASCAYHNYSCKIDRTEMEFNFPDLGLDFLNEWRRAYRGGRCQVNPLHQGKLLSHVKRYDINSMYPAIMYSCPLPYGHPIECKERGHYRFELYHVKIAFYLLEGHMPTLLKKGSRLGLDTYYVNTDDVEEIWITSIDMELLERHYYIYYLEYVQILGFHTSKLLFSYYVSRWYKRKQADKGAKKVIDKLMLNSLYGKFGSNPLRSNKLPFYNPISEMVEFTLSEEEEAKHYYLPVAMAITSYGHLWIDDGIQATGYENFAYCDTDSVHTLAELPPEMVHNTKLGKFKLEATEKIAKYLRQKSYMTYEDNAFHITCAGMPDKSKELFLETYKGKEFDNFKDGMSIGGKLLPKRVKGGTILHETNFTIKT